MKSARSLSKLLVSGAAVAALVTSCTIETKSGGSTGGSSSGTTGGALGTTGGSSATTGGASATGGTSSTTGGSVATTGGSTAATGGAVTEAGSGGDSGGIGGTPGGAGQGASDAGGQGGASFDDCDACVDAKCTAFFDACLADPLCISEQLDGSGQYEQIIACTEQIRTTRPVKRVDLRNCGTAVGTGSLWPPDEMTEATLNLVNCIATGDAVEKMNNAWADSSNISNPWVMNSCAKLACTSQLP